MTHKNKSSTSQSFEEQYLADLEIAFQAALKNKNIATAIRAKELQAKVIERQNKDNSSKKITLKNLSKADIKMLLKEIDHFQFENPKEVSRLKLALKTSIKATSSNCLS